MENWVKEGPEFLADGLSIAVLRDSGPSQLLAVSAKAGRFYYAEKVEGLSTEAVAPENVWFLNFLGRAKRNRERQAAILCRT